MQKKQKIKIRHDWSLEEIKSLYSKQFLDLLFQAMTIHRENFPKNKFYLSTLLNLKSGNCPEDCAYCAQSVHYKTAINKHDLISVELVTAAAIIAKKNGAKRLCMGAAWRQPPDKQFVTVLEMIKAVKAMGLETCVTLGTLDESQVVALKAAGLDYYSHNVDTSPDYYRKIITTRLYQDRIATIKLLSKAKIKICCGGIIGMGEEIDDRLVMLQELANFPKHPHSVPINRFIPTKGTPLENITAIDPFDFVKIIAVARILMPRSIIRLAAGRDAMSYELQTLCFIAGVNSIFVGEKLLTAVNASIKSDEYLLQKLGIR